VSENFDWVYAQMPDGELSHKAIANLIELLNSIGVAEITNGEEN
jgi:hypothetical protein